MDRVVEALDGLGPVEGFLEIVRRLVSEPEGP
jgi:hypothetical protein